MLGIYLLVCMAVYFLIELKAYSLVKGGEPSVELSAEPRTYEVCRRAVILGVVSKIVALIGYLGCAWPYLFIEGVGLSYYLSGVLLFGIYPIFFITLGCYMEIRNAQGYIRISTDEIEYKRHRAFTIKISDIKKITCPGLAYCVVYLIEKGKKPLGITLNGFYQKQELCSLMRQLGDYSAKASGRDQSLACRLSRWGGEKILGKYCSTLLKMIIVILLVYTSYCCIDYDFVRKDYTSRYNALNADAGQAENAWPHYVQAAADCVELEENLQKMIESNIDSDRLDFTDSQKEELKSWFSKNSASWTILKKATSIDYCKAVYKQISFMNNQGRRDFSNPSDSGYAQIRDLYGNTSAGLRAKVFDLDWFELFGMQLASSSHFINGKSYLDQLAGYGLLGRSIHLLAEQDRYALNDLQKVRVLLKKQFPSGVPLLNIEGEMLIQSNSFDEMINIKRILVQSPLNPMFLLMGSSTGSESYIRNHHTAILEQVARGMEYKSEEFSIIGFPIMRKMFFSMLEGSTVKIFQYALRADTNLSAAYFMLDLEEYRLMKGSYPADVSQLNEAGFNSELPDDIDSGGKIIYRNDGQRTVLYAVGYNAIDDGGFSDQRGSGGRDDIVYWQRDVKTK
jgi:hypothetical protein